MSLYNMVMGTNPFAGMLLALLGFQKPNEEIPRLRDCYVDQQGYVVILTRTGGGNRAEYAEGNAKLAALPGFVGTMDWQLDTTFALWVYNLTDDPEADEIAQQLAGIGARMDLDAKFTAAVEDLGSPNPKPSTLAALERLRPTMKQVAEFVQGVEPALTLLDSDHPLHKGGQP